MNFADLLKNATGALGHMYRVGVRGDEQQPYNAGANGEQQIFRTKRGETYATNDWGSIVPISPVGQAKPTPTPQVLGVNAVAPAPTTTPPVQGLTFDQLLEGYGRYGATPSAQAVKLMAEAQDRYPVFKENPALLPAMSIVETGAGKYMTRPRGENPQNLMNWGIYTDFVPRDQAHSVERAISGIGERMPYYNKFRQTKNLEDFANVYAPAGDNNEGYLGKLRKAMQYFGDY